MVPARARPAWAACSRARLRANLELLAGRVGGRRRVLAVLKADAYGHGAVEAGRALAAAGVAAFGVATLDEAAQLRRAGLRGALLLLGPLEPSHAGRARRLDLTATAWSRHWLERASRACGPGPGLRVHLKVDTGMNRLGFAPGDVPGVLGDFQAGRWPGLVLGGAYTHLARADEARDRMSPRQIKAFCALPWPRGLALHAANSAGALRYPWARLSLVRSGMLLYGALDSNAVPPARGQQPVLKAHAAIVRVAKVAKGAGIGYGGTFKAPRDMHVATVCAGYADGVPWRLGNRGRVRIAGRLCRMVGRVSMDSFMADVSRVPEARVGATADLLGDTDGPCSVRGWARTLETSPYEVLCGLSARLPRIWED